MSKPGRNQPCPCGSGKKYKNCCLAQERVSQPAAVTNLNGLRMRKTEGRLAGRLMDYLLGPYGEESVAEAWDQFTFWGNVPFDPEGFPEIDTIFMPWFLFNWEPETREEDPEYPDITIAQHFLEHGGGSLSSYERRFIEAGLGTAPRFYEVREVKAGEGLLLHDLFLGGNVFVFERIATETAFPGGVLYARVVTLDDASIMIGCAPMIFPPRMGLQLLDIRDDWRRTYGPMTAVDAWEQDFVLREVYFDLRKELTNPKLPEMQNTDGEAIELTELQYAIDCTPMEALEAMKTLALVKDAAELTHDAEFEPDGTLRRVVFTWLRKNSGRASVMQHTVLGHISLEPGEMLINVNSKERAEQIERKVQRRLGRRARLLDYVVKPLDDKSLAEMAQEGPGASAGMSALPEDLSQSPEIQALLQQTAAQYWEDWLDTSIPALNGETPRQAARSAGGRERLELLLCAFASRQSGDPRIAPDVDAIRKKLGLG